MSQTPATTDLTRSPHLIPSHQTPIRTGAHPRALMPPDSMNVAQLQPFRGVLGTSNFSRFYHSLNKVPHTSHTFHTYNMPL